jgi:hypothetical protein
MINPPFGYNPFFQHIVTITYFQADNIDDFQNKLFSFILPAPAKGIRGEKCGNR